MSGRILVIGAGAAGLMAACAAADGGAQVTVLEHNEKAGKKLYITGKGRCNYTNACETQDFFRNVLRNPKFLYSAVCGFDSAAMTDFLQNNGCPTREERGQRCFPASDHAYDVTDALVRHLRNAGGRLRYRCGVRSVLVQERACGAERPAGGREIRGTERPAGGREIRGAGQSSGRGKVHSADQASFGRMVCGVELTDGRKLPADAVIVATGGLSYPSTGSTGDGYRFAEELGLSVKAPQPSLVPLTVRESWAETLQGLSLKNVSVRVEPLQTKRTAGPEGASAPDRTSAPERAAAPVAGSAGLTGAPERTSAGGKKAGASRPVYEGFGEMLFTHFGVSGPLILSASCHTDFAACPEGYLLHLDLKPALSTEKVTERLRREFTAVPGRELRNALRPLLPQRLAETVSALFAGQTGWDPAAPVRAMDGKRAGQLAALLKDITLHLTGTRGFEEAVVTRGGIDVRQINPSTMETRGLAGLYWAGEVLDVDAYTGGYNLQIAWSTGHLAGVSAAKACR